MSDQKSNKELGLPDHVDVTRVEIDSVEELEDIMNNAPNGAPSKEELLKKIKLNTIVGGEELKAQGRVRELPVPAKTPPKAFDPRRAIVSKFNDDVGRIKAQNEVQRKPNVITGLKTKIANKELVTKHQHKGNRLKRDVISARPPDAPSIIEECVTPIKLAISQHQSPGDILMLSAAVRDLHAAYPGMFETKMLTPAAEIWENNPHASDFHTSRPEVMWLEANYPLINRSNQGAHHFIHGFHQEFEAKLGLRIPVMDFKGDIHLTEEERQWASQVREIKDVDLPFWLIDAGCKRDFTTKQWEVDKYQQVVDTLPGVTFVQIGAAKDLHKPLRGDNVLNLLGKTTLRQLIRLMYHAAGVITPISLPMHLAAAVPLHPRFKRKHRPCVVIAGGREPAVWEAYTHHQYLHTCGMLPCCEEGGCWANRVVPLLDGDGKDLDKPCLYPTESKSGQIIPKCMDMISVSSVVDKVNMYHELYDYSSADAGDWANKMETELPKEVMEKRAQAKEAKKSDKTKVINRKKE